MVAGAVITYMRAFQIGDRVRISNTEGDVIERSLDDFSVHYELNAVTHKPNRMPAISSEMHRNMLDRFYAAAVEIASPHYAAVRDGNRVAIPEDNLPGKYQAPAFRIEALGINPKIKKTPEEL